MAARPLLASKTGTSGGHLQTRGGPRYVVFQGNRKGQSLSRVHLVPRHLLSDFSRFESNIAKRLIPGELSHRKKGIYDVYLPFGIAATL